MSTVLWANVLVEGTVVSDEQDRHALYRHADKLDSLSKELALPSFLSACDHTDMRFNLEDMELPEGAQSTSHVMAVSGAWLSRDEADRMLDSLLKRIRDKNTRFGLLSNQQAQVLAELDEVLAFLRSRPDAEKFNFSVVM